VDKLVGRRIMYVYYAIDEQEAEQAISLTVPTTTRKAQGLLLTSFGLYLRM